MSGQELQNLERLVNYIAYHFLKKQRWQEVSKAEWIYVSGEFNTLAQKQTRNKTDILLLGDNYFYEHLVIKRLKPAAGGQAIAGISSPNFSKMNVIASVMGYDSYIDFISNAGDTYSFGDLKINIPAAALNTALLDHITGSWYCYNRNLPFHAPEEGAERVWRSALEIYKSGDEYLVERSGKDNHMYYGKATAYGEYIFIIMNSTTFIRQRHFIGRLKDVQEQLRHGYAAIDQLKFVSTCVSFNEEPIALYEVFDRVKKGADFEKRSVGLPMDSPALPENIRQMLRDVGLNRLAEH